MNLLKNFNKKGLLNSFIRSQRKQITFNNFRDEMNNRTLAYRMTKYDPTLELQVLFSLKRTSNP